MLYWHVAFINSKTLIMKKATTLFYLFILSISLFSCTPENKIQEEELQEVFQTGGDNSSEVDNDRDG